MARNRRNSRRVNNISFFKKNSFCHPPLPLTPHCISGCWQSGMMARGPWINPQPDVYASPVCLIGSPPLRTTLVPLPSRHHPVIVNGNSVMWRGPSHCDLGLVVSPLSVLQRWPRVFRGCCEVLPTRRESTNTVGMWTSSSGAHKNMPCSIK